MSNQEITENFHKEERKFAAAKQVFDSFRKGHMDGIVSGGRFDDAKAEYDIAAKRYDIAFEATKAPTIKQIVDDAIPGIPSAEAVRAMNEPIMIEVPTMPIELTEDQLGLLKACTAAQRQFLSMQAEKYPKDREVCRLQGDECVELHDIFTTAQISFIRARREGEIS